ncbi:MAG: Acetylornithine deacetylase or succinyl-diaminopimelate desuccinylase [Thermotoga sp. 47_83]|jgi:succinyl-diaminopimelate desuccinylase|uniref:M20 family metallo-hydrolase n=1 Tax=Thermotoga sp. Mc24 TaxID=1231241 RepID=UPI000541DF84|nr:M20 family metallo-hydrolase [Thermotoga sp. Mc24]KHC92415.1 diaminopimelate aminotransferase [Thermotoga sp. Mc24]KUK33191.1 MAG: Acetylornithine deacetylase or succinyl-diaminopimelate desuccinylase [Thermotoga sp. 47_83]MBZ4661673.1 acetylornithine deacetylase or succinyl-diaminopimelate desuccinylase [Thermotoga sp.]HAA83166.1 diaminopimelate aminotransferase [Thermotoga petrophila]
MELTKRMEELREDMVESLKKFITINSVNPAFGGPGEREKADWLEELLRGFGFEVDRYDVKDDKGMWRSNVVAKIPGKNREKTLWIVTHIDTVPPGDLSLWETDPFVPVVKDGKVYGRGAEDNGGSMIASIYAGKVLIDLGIVPEYNFGLALVADEEAGSRYGIQYLIEKGLFRSEDMFLVPDAGNEKGNFIEIAEKSILWFKVTVNGKQGHASRPRTTENALRKGAQLITEIDETLHRKYPDRDELFDEPLSTFEPTRTEKTVDNVNTVPGRFVFYFDCRVLPRYDLDEILSTVESILDGRGAELEVVVKQPAPEPTPPDSELVAKLSSALGSLRGLEAKVGGIGGGTCAAFFRKKGWPAVVWSTIDGTAHQPNEYRRISHMVEDAKVFALLGIER